MNNIMLFIPFSLYNKVGGPATFMNNLKYFMDTHNLHYSETCHKADAIFFPITYNLKTLNKLKKKYKQIIQRLDGVYYPSKHGEKYIELNSEIKKIYLDYATHIIFQSEYSKKQCFELFGLKNQDEYTIIYNGVNKKIFFPNPQENLRKNKKVKFVTTGNFRNIDMIEPIVKALDELNNDFEFELNVVGPITKKSLESYFQRGYIHLLGTKTLTQIAEILRENHIFLYSHLNPPCPNSVLEAVSCGLPVVGFDSGSMKELLSFSDELLASVSTDVFQKYEDFNYLLLKEKLMQVVQDYD
ncbi:MAG: glycosyltransferase family 4 protein, partial [Spirochaetes bacterium]|nr:glycosyltransferase family 4 protein [Spirochaetota bacterium]